MKCPKCSSLEDKVLESRSIKEGTAIRRRRMCTVCGFRFTSYEHIERKPIVVIKKDGRRQAFELSKVERGLITCTEKLPLTQDQLDEVLMKIEDRVREIAQANRNTITSSQIGEETLRQLYPLSPVAGVRFAAVYRAFDTLDQFKEEIESLLK